MAPCGFAQRPLKVSKDVSLCYLLSGTKQAKRAVRGRRQEGATGDRKGQCHRAVCAPVQGVLADLDRAEAVPGSSRLHRAGHEGKTGGDRRGRERLGEGGPGVGRVLVCTAQRGHSPARLLPTHLPGVQVLQPPAPEIHPIRTAHTLILGPRSHDTPQISGKHMAKG